jgi:acyl dehydratase
MSLDKECIGRAYPHTESHEVGHEKIREFVDAIGEPSPATRNLATARELSHPDIIAPPTFPIVLSMRADNQAQRFVYHRPVRAGDPLTAEVAVMDIDHVGGNEVITTRGKIRTVDGEPVCTTTSTIASRAETGA